MPGRKLVKFTHVSPPTSLCAISLHSVLGCNVVAPSTNLSCILPLPLLMLLFLYFRSLGAGPVTFASLAARLLWGRRRGGAFLDTDPTYPPRAGLGILVRKEFFFFPILMRHTGYRRCESDTPLRMFSYLYARNTCPRVPKFVVVSFTTEQAWA